MDTIVLLLKSKRLVSMVKKAYQQCGNKQEVIYTLAQEQGFMLDIEEVSAMINKRRKKKNYI